MRLPFKFDESNLNEDARIKFTYTTPELHQNIEISLDAEQTSVDSLIDAFERFLSALGVHIPDNVLLQFVSVDLKDGEGEESEEEDEDDDEDQEKGF